MQATYNAYNPRQLKDVILQSLGAPIINIEVTEAQIYMCIQKALELFGEYHFDGVNKDFRVIVITDDADLTGTFDLKDRSIFSVTRIIRSGQTLRSAMKDTNNLWAYQLFNQLFGVGIGSCSGFGYSVFGMDLGYLDQIMERQKTLQEFIDPIPDFHYNDTNGQLKIFDSYKKGDIIVVEVLTKSYVDVEKAQGNVAGFAQLPNSGSSDSHNVYTANEIYQNPDLQVNTGVFAGGSDVTKLGSYNNRWVKEYATQSVKYLWGQTLSKFDGINLPGGVAMNGRMIMEDAKIALDELKEELRELEMPVGAMWG